MPNDIADTTVTSTVPATKLALDPPGLRPPDTAEDVLANTRALLPLIAEEADAIERGARLSPAAESAMRAAGVFEMGFPSSRGGLEMTLAQQVEVVAEISSVDASAGWNVGVLNAGGYYAGRLGDAAYAELYPSRDRPTSGSFHPRGRAERVDGGFLVSGRWDWGSGSYTADHIVGGCLVVDGDGEPVLRADGGQEHFGIWLPSDAIVPLDNWQTLGVRGSGSTSYVIEEPAFVPAEHSFDREAPFDPDADPLNKTVKICHFALTGVSLGVARHLVRLAGEGVRAKGGRLDPVVAQNLGQAMGEVDMAYSGVREIARVTDEVIFRPGGQLTPLQEARMTAANAMSALTLRRVLDLCTELAGARYILDVNPINRVIRDALGALAHAGTRRAHLSAQADAAVAHLEGGFTLPDDPTVPGFAGWPA